MANKLKDLTGKVVTFQLYPSAIVTDDFTNVKVVGVTTHEGVSDKISPVRMHALVYPTLPAETPNDYRLYEYAIIKKQDGTLTAVGLPWVKENSIVVIGSIELLVTIRNKTADDVTRLRKVLMENNFTDIEIKTNGIDTINT